MNNGLAFIHKIGALPTGCVDDVMIC